MAKSARTFDNWRVVYYATKDDCTKSLAFKNAVKSAVTFGQWFWVYLEAKEGSEVKDPALGNLMGLADNPIDAAWTKDKETQKLIRWKRIFEISEPGSAVETSAMLRLKELMCAEKDRQAKRQ